MCCADNHMLLLGSQAYLTNTLWYSVKVAEQFLCCSEHHCDVAASEHRTMSHQHEMSTPQHVPSELYVMGCKVICMLDGKVLSHLALSCCMSDFSAVQPALFDNFPEYMLCV